ncbi:hypothetical protein FSP39_022179 [Pinctada imbricata]|uniref:Uncharacterized protein n=1 Tax=Pinctada imbricata TaxID=66713 RepID=A0AA88YJE2_PINIB|nr:hypothetical protein FSP39_022179 [Pinctada imbricata]
MEYAVTLLLCIIITILVWLWNQTRRAANWPPGPPTIPFLGNLNINFGDLLNEFRKFHQQYGNIYSLVLGSKTVVVINGLDTLKEMFIKHGDVVNQRADTIVTSEITKHKGIASSSGSIWKEHRTFALSTLKDFGFGKRSMEGKILEEVVVFQESIRKTRGNPFNIAPLLRTSVSNVICSVALGSRFEHDDVLFTNIMDSISEVMGHNAMYGTLTYFPFLRYIPGDPLKFGKMKKKAETIYSYIQELIDNHKSTPGLEENDVTNYLDAYIKRQKTENMDSTFTDDQLQKAIFDLLVVGTDTTATALRWFILIILHKPEIQERMRAEIQREVGESKYPSTGDRSNLPYCDSVLHEVLRFGNIAPFPLPHVLTEDINFQGYFIPKHALLIPNLDSVLNDPDIFETPSEFKPTRFLAKDGTLTGKEKVVTFGIGPRICMGESLARMELFLFALSMIQRFKFLPADGDVLPSIFEYNLGLTREPLPFKCRVVECI